MSAHDIHKASGILLQDRKVLVTRSRGKENFVHPGGKLEQGETPKQALVRELKEELNIDVAIWSHSCRHPQLQPTHRTYRYIWMYLAY